MPTIRWEREPTTLWGKVDPDPTGGCAWLISSRATTCRGRRRRGLRRSGPTGCATRGAELDDGNLWIADAGNTGRDFTPATSTGGENYGWDTVEGRLATSPRWMRPPRPHAAGAHVQPRGRSLLDHGYLYGGRALPMLVGVFADYCTGEIWAGQQRAEREPAARNGHAVLHLHVRRDRAREVSPSTRHAATSGAGARDELRAPADASFRPCLEDENRTERRNGKRVDSFDSSSNARRSAERTATTVSAPTDRSGRRHAKGPRKPPLIGRRAALRTEARTTMIGLLLGILVFAPTAPSRPTPSTSVRRSDRNGRSTRGHAQPLHRADLDLPTARRVRRKRARPRRAQPWRAIASSRRRRPSPSHRPLSIRYAWIAPCVEREMFTQHWPIRDGRLEVADRQWCDPWSEGPSSPRSPAPPRSDWLP